MKQQANQTAAKQVLRLFAFVPVTSYSLGCGSCKEQIALPHSGASVNS
jgi:hypothetical protein